MDDSRASREMTREELLTALLTAHDRIRELEARQQWRPIETAPRDNHARLVWCPDLRNIYIVTWHPEHVWFHFGGDRVLTETPTHWMPLPEPPKCD